MKHVRISLREVLLVVALFAVLLAWISARLEMQRIKQRSELEGMELWRKFASNHPDTYTSEQAWRADVLQLDAQIAERRKSLGEPEQHR